MMELTIDNTVYEFQFGMGFMRDVNKMAKVPVDGMPGVEQEVGLRYMIAKVIDGEPDALVDILFAANKGRKPRVTRQILDEYIDQEDTNIDALFDETLDFLEEANATKKTMKRMKDAFKEANPEQN